MVSVFSAAGFALAIMGLVLTTYYARKAERLNNLRRRLDWSDLQTAARDLGRRIKRDFHPAAMVTPGLTGATFANLLASEFPNQPQVFVGTRTWRADPYRQILTDNSFVINTNTWVVTVPRTPASLTSGVILIVDDVVLSGDFLSEIRSQLIAAGVAADRIRAVSVAVSKIAISNGKAPDYYWWKTNDDDFYFPWGRAR